MIGICYAKSDEAGRNMASHIVEKYDFAALEGQQPAVYDNGEARVCEIEEESGLLGADFLDSLKFDLILFLSMHRSEAGVGIFSTHSLGNWSEQAKFGGRGKQLSCAAPVAMLSALTSLSKISEPIGKRYEATHHGPLLKTPSLFVEIGGNEETIRNKKYAGLAAEAAYEAVISAKEEEVKYRKVVVGIGSNHYPEKFSALAIDGGYAFSHIMPKYAITNEDGSNNLDVLEQTLKRSTHEPEAAVIEWKSMNTATREETIKKLDEMGLDYEKV